MALDSAGYFWTRGKIISASSQPFKSKYPNNKGKYTEFPRKKVESPSFTVIDLNLIADDDNIKQISYLINGGFNGFEERKKFFNKLKELFSCENL